ncbi:HAMP domain-containing sensor histidine kinase [uncultured Oscillibacter sp.]|uniref:sensor histidine kinase n=1 Tax=uncultured Oscillibacter sp. TaxID=876091 RepID=UPI002805D6CE|nr:HAMP domain-containing sensor histidine kinase [uncultured Oscillibacter sp.]
MSRREHPGDAFSARSRRRAVRAWGAYLLALLGWVFAVVAIALLGIIVCAGMIWQPSPLYYFLQWVREYIVLCCTAVVLMGWIWISYYFISKPIKQLDALAGAAERLSKPDEEPIQLPPSLEDLAIQLNTARERALRDARAAREAEQRKNDLIVYLAHDLKTPLTSVIGYLTLLRDEPQVSPETRAKYTGIALEKAERLEELINEFFDITRFNLSHLELELQPVDLTRMLEQIASEFGPILAEKELQCRLDLPPKLVCSCDPNKLARVFDNLLRNASYYSLPDSTVDIAGRQEEGEIVLTFSNAGKAIPQEKLDRIFEQFFRLDSSRATRTGGAGLGLAIAREIVALHGGTIRADSAGDRITFTLRLPV